MIDAVRHVGAVLAGASLEQVAALRELAASPVRGEADWARAVLLMLAGQAVGENGGSFGVGEAWRTRRRRGSSEASGRPLSKNHCRRARWPSSPHRPSGIRCASPGALPSPPALETSSGSLRAVAAPRRACAAATYAHPGQGWPRPRHSSSLSSASPLPRISSACEASQAAEGWGACLEGGAPWRPSGRRVLISGCCTHCGDERGKARSPRVRSLGTR